MDEVLKPISIDGESTLLLTAQRFGVEHPDRYPQFKDLICQINYTIRIR